MGLRHFVPSFVTQVSPLSKSLIFTCDQKTNDEQNRLMPGHVTKTGSVRFAGPTHTALTSP